MTEPWTSLLIFHLFAGWVNICMLQRLNAHDGDSLYENPAIGVFVILLGVFFWVISGLVVMFSRDVPPSEPET